MVRGRCVRRLLAVAVESVADRNGDRPALVAAHGVLAAGVLTTAFVPGTVGVLAGGALFGATFVGIVGVGVDLAASLHALDPTRAIAVMTIAFAVGQMVGPAVGGWLADATGTFRVPSVVAAVVLVAGAAFLLPQSGHGTAPPDGPAVAVDGVGSTFHPSRNRPLRRARAQRAPSAATRPEPTLPRSSPIVPRTHSASSSSSTWRPTCGWAMRRSRRTARATPSRPRA